MALLLFLVCAVIGAVVLTAGTAAAGRVSRLAEMDQRYYSVSCAAQLLAEELSGKTVTVVRSREYTERITKEYEVSDDASGDDVSLSDTETTRTAVYSTSVNGAPYGADVTVTTDGSSDPRSSVGVSNAQPGTSFLTSRAVALMFGSVGCNTDAAMNCSFANGNAAGDYEFTIEHTAAGVDAASLLVKGSCRMQSDGTMVIRLRDGADYDNFVLILTLEPSFMENTDNSGTSTGAPTVTPTASGYTEVTEKVSKVTKTSTVSWSVQSIVKEVSEPDENP